MVRRLGYNQKSSLLSQCCNNMWHVDDKTTQMQIVHMCVHDRNCTLRLFDVTMLTTVAAHRLISSGLSINLFQSDIRRKEECN